MTNKLHIKTVIQKYLLSILQIGFFALTAVLAAIMNLFSSTIEIKRPAILLTGSIFSLLCFKANENLAVISKIILLYIIEMLFNQVAGRFIRIGSFSISLSMAAIVPLAISFICHKFQETNLTFKTCDLFKGWTAACAMITLHMLLLYVLLRSIYGYGYNHNFATAANLCLYFLVFLFSQKQLEQTNIRMITATIFIIMFVIKIVRGI